MLDMQLYYGKAKTFRLTIRDASGALVDLSGKTVRFSVKAGRNTTAALITKTSGSGITHDADQPGVGKGLASLRILPNDTLANAAFLYNVVATFVVELEVIQVASEPEILDAGHLTISPAVRTTV